MTLQLDLNRRLNRLRRWNIEVTGVSLATARPVITINRPLPSWQRGVVDVFVHVSGGTQTRQHFRSMPWSGVYLKWPVSN